MPADRILLGVIGRPHGVRGLVHVTSHAANPADLTAYGPLSDDRGRCFTLRWRSEGLVEVAQQVDGATIRIADRAAAEKLTNTRLYVERAVLPPPGEDEFYLADLVGLDATDTAGTRVGAVAAVHDYGAGTSLEITRPDGPSLFVPFTRGAVPVVDVQAGRLVVDEHMARDAGDGEAPDTRADAPAGHAGGRDPAARRRVAGNRTSAPQPGRPSQGARRAPAPPATGRGPR